MSEKVRPRGEQILGTVTAVHGCHPKQGKFIYLGINFPKAGDISGISGLEKYYSGSLPMLELLLIGEN